MSAYKPYTEPRTGRAVLGDKTTNARARASQPTIGKTPALREVEKSQAKLTTVSRPKSSAPKAESSKLNILQDTTSDPLSASEPDTNLPPPEPLPYESDVWPAGVLTFDALRPENRLNGYFEYYHNRRDENGMTRLDRESKAAQERRFREADARIRKDLDEDFKWDLGLLDSPKKTQQIVPARDPEPVGKWLVRPGGATKVPSTINSRRAASALGMAGKPTTSTLQRRPLATRTASSTNTTSSSRIPSFMQPTASKPRLAPDALKPKPSSTAGVAASRSTLGYTRGRSASSAVNATGRARSRSIAPSRAHARTPSTAGGDRMATATSRSPTEDHAEARPEFVSIFDEPPRDDSFFGKDDGEDAAGLLGEGEGGDESSFSLELNL